MFTQNFMAPKKEKEQKLFSKTRTIVSVGGALLFAAYLGFIGNARISKMLNASKLPENAQSTTEAFYFNGPYHTKTGAIYSSVSGIRYNKENKVFYTISCPAHLLEVTAPDGDKVSIGDLTTTGMEEQPITFAFAGERTQRTLKGDAENNRARNMCAQVVAEFNKAVITTTENQQKQLEASAEGLFEKVVGVVSPQTDVQPLPETMEPKMGEETNPSTHTMTGFSEDGAQITVSYETSSKEGKDVPVSANYERNDRNYKSVKVMVTPTKTDVVHTVHVGSQDHYLFWHTLQDGKVTTVVMHDTRAFGEEHPWVSSEVQIEPILSVKDMENYRAIALKMAETVASKDSARRNDAALKKWTADKQTVNYSITP